MTLLRRKLLGAAALAAWLLLGCGSVAPLAPSAPGAALSPPVDAAARQALAPMGALRVGVYPGSPTSMLRDARTGDKVGVALNLGQSLAARLGVPVQVVEFERVAQVVEAVKTGAVDFTFTNATEARARDVDFTPPMLQVELGYLVPQGSAIQTIGDVDRPGVRVGITQGSSSQATLSRLFKYATLTPATSLQQAQDMLRQGQVQAYATNKAVLSEMQDKLPGFKILDGRWGEEHMAIAIPKGREAGMPLLRQFAQDAKASGLLQSIVAKSGLRGTVAAN